MKAKLGDDYVAEVKMKELYPDLPTSFFENQSMEVEEVPDTPSSISSLWGW